MLLWIGIIVGGAFAWNFSKRGILESWTFFFNLLVSVYLAIFLQAVISAKVSIGGDTAYSCALTTLASAIGFFLLFQAVSYTFFTSQFSASFPRLLDIIGSGALGFLAGLLVWCFVALLVCLTPLSQSTLARGINFEDEFKNFNAPYLCWWCDAVNTIVTPAENRTTCRQVTETLSKSAKRKKFRRRAIGRTTPPRRAQSDPNTPAAVNESPVEPAKTDPPATRPLPSQGSSQ